MRNLKAILLALSLLALVGCSDAADPEVLDDSATDVAATISAAQQDLQDLGENIQDTEAAAELEAAWEDLQANLTPVFTSLQTDEPVDADRIEQMLEDFQAELEAVEGDLEPEVRDTWESLRDHIERLIEQVG